MTQAPAFRPQRAIQMDDALLMGAARCTNGRNGAANLSMAKRSIPDACRLFSHSTVAFCVIHTDAESTERGWWLRNVRGAAFVCTFGSASHAFPMSEWLKHETKRRAYHLPRTRYFSRVDGSIRLDCHHLHALANESLTTSEGELMARGEGGMGA